MWIVDRSQKFITTAHSKGRAVTHSCDSVVMLSTCAMRCSAVPDVWVVDISQHTPHLIFRPRLRHGPFENMLMMSQCIMSCSTELHLWVVDIFQNISTAHSEARARGPPGLPLLSTSPIILKDTIKHSAILKGEHTIAMLLVLLPLPLIAGACCIVKGSVAMPLPILKCALVPASIIFRTLLWLRTPDLPVYVIKAVLWKSR